MPFHLLAVLGFALLAAGCMTQRDTTDTDATTGTDTTATDAPMPGAPNIAVYLDGTWELSLVPRGGGERHTGTWTIAEDGANRFATAQGLDAPVRVAERWISGDVFSVSGVVETPEGPAPFEAGGTLQGHEMHGEVTIEGIGTFDLTGTRRLD